MKGRQWQAMLTHEMREAKGQLSRALSGPSTQRTHGVSIHEARKSIKRLRAAFRLLRDAFPPGAFQEINRSLRDVGRAVSPLRDEEVLWKTLVKLTRATGIRPLKTSGTSPSQGPILDALQKLEPAERLLRKLPWEKIDEDLLRGGLKRLYRRGQRSLIQAESNRSNIRLHTWRKRTKDLGYALHLTGFEESPAGKQAVRLAKHLGDDHDLALFQKKPSVQSGGNVLHQNARKARRKDQEKAFRIGHRLFLRRPKSFVRHLIGLDGSPG